MRRSEALVLTDHWQEFRFNSFENFIVEMNDQIGEDRSVIGQIEISQGLFILFRTVRRLIFLNPHDDVEERRSFFQKNRCLPRPHCTVAKYGEISRCSSSRGSDNRYLRFSSRERKKDLSPKGRDRDSLVTRGSFLIFFVTAERNPATCASSSTKSMYRIHMKRIYAGKPGIYFAARRGFNSKFTQ